MVSVYDIDELLRYFEKRYVINLDMEFGRYRKFQNTATRYNIDAVRVSAIPSPAKEPCNIGAGLSHQKCVRMAKSEGLQNVLNFEDDVAFLETTEDVIKDNIDFLNKKDWEYHALSYIYWGSEYQFLQDVSSGNIKMLAPGVVQFTNCNNKKGEDSFISSACCVAYNSTIFEKFLDEFPHLKYTMDRWNTNNFRVTAPFPCIAWQYNKECHLPEIEKFNRLVNKHLL